MSMRIWFLLSVTVVCVFHPCMGIKAFAFNSFGGSNGLMFSKHSRRDFLGRCSFPTKRIAFSDNDRKPWARSRRGKRTTQKYASLPFGGNIEDIVYTLQSSASGLATSTFSSPNANLSLSSMGILYLAGLLTSFSPCSLGILPLTISYISQATGERSDKTSLFPTLAFASGLASVFVALGLSVSLLGGVFGSNEGGENALGNIILIGLSSGISILMGLQLLELVNLPLPSLDISAVSLSQTRTGETTTKSEAGPSDSSYSILEFDDEGELILERPRSSSAMENSTGASALLRTFLLGGSSALVASPCATPVLTTILAYVAANRDPTVGGALLLSYTLGYSTLLLIVGGSGGQFLARIQDMSVDNTTPTRGGEGTMLFGSIGKMGQLVTPITASVLLWYGTNGLLNGLFGDPSLAALAPIL